MLMGKGRYNMYNAKATRNILINSFVNCYLICESYHIVKISIAY